MPDLLGSEPLAQSDASHLFSENLPALSEPQSLTIRFSRASDIDTFVDLYSGPRKYRIDPKGFVRKRSYEELVQSVKSGAAVLALDENGEIRASALAQRHKQPKLDDKYITEIGAVMCDIGGVGLPNLVVGMLALKQQFDPHASANVFAKVARDNGASNHVFSNSMQWDLVQDNEKCKTLFDAAYQGKDGNRTRLWYQFNAEAVQRAEDALKKAIMDEALHGKNGKKIPLNVSASSLWSTLQFHEMLASPDAAA